MTGDKQKDLVDLVATALALADDLGLSEVGLRLDQALIALTGEGVAPPLDDSDPPRPGQSAGPETPVRQAQYNLPA